MRNISQKRIVITGLGTVSGVGQNAQDFYDSVYQGKDGLAIGQDWEEQELGGQYYYPGAELDIKKDFEQLRPPFPLKYSQLAMIGCMKAVRDANLETFEMDRGRIGMIINTTFAANAAVDRYLRKLYSAGPRKARPFTFTRTVSNCALGDITRYFKFRGPSSILLGENSICYGMDVLRSGDADVMVCGGFDELREVVMLSYHSGGKSANTSQTGAASYAKLTSELEQAGDPDKTVLGEASAFVVLEELEHAKARGATIYGELRDYATVRDARTNDYISERNAEDFRYVMQAALEASEVSCQEVDAVLGSVMTPMQAREQELKAVGEVWQDHPVNYSLVKPFIGETFGASAAAGMVAAALMLQRDEVLGTHAEAEQFGTLPGGVRLSAKGRPAPSPLRNIMVNGIHAGGNTSSIILAKAS